MTDIELIKAALEAKLADIASRKDAVKAEAEAVLAEEETLVKGLEGLGIQAAKDVEQGVVDAAEGVEGVIAPEAHEVQAGAEAVA